MRLTILAIVIAVGVGLAAGGRPSNLASVRARWPLLAPVGLALQLLPVPGRVLPMALLYVSFLLLLVFAVINLRIPGGALILLGLVLNLTVIAWNSGMPVTRHALIASHQENTLSELIHDGGAKHHLATAHDRLLPLADAVPIGWDIDQVVSLGDIATYLGIMWLIVASMRRREDLEPWISTLPPPGRAVGLDVAP
jgi:hypothetical protein